MVDLFGPVSVQLARKYVSQPVFFGGSHKGVKYYLTLFTLTCVESHNFQPKRVIQLVGTRVIVEKLGDECLLLSMRSYYSDAWYRIQIKQFDNSVNNPFCFKNVDITLVDETVVIDCIEFDDILYGIAANFHDLEAIAIEIFRGKTDHLWIGSEMLF